MHLRVTPLGQGEGLGAWPKMHPRSSRPCWSPFGS